MQQRRTVVLDWDGTLAAVIPDGIITRPVHAARAMEINMISLPLDQEGKAGRFLLILRPFLYEFILTLNASYQLALWSFGTREYVERCLQFTGLHKVFNGPNVVTRAEMQNWDTRFKDIYLLKERLGATMQDTVIVDDAHSSFGLLNPYNCVDVPSWAPAMRQDTCLRSLPALIEQRFDFLRRYSEEDLVARRAEILALLD
jgi:phosphoglycolate phosphatase-like HAD superfamily hydrolase